MLCHQQNLNIVYFFLQIIEGAIVCNFKWFKKSIKSGYLHFVLFSYLQTQLRDEN